MIVIMEAIYRRIFSKNFRRSTINVFSRTITTTPACSVEAMEELGKNPYFEKYAQKIAKLQQTTPEELLSRIHAQEIKKQPEVKTTLEDSNPQQFISLLKPKENLSSRVEVKDEPLSKIMKIELVQEKTVNEIKRIWEEYHIKKDVIAATVPTTEYNLIHEQAKKYPLFIFPLPRSQGYEFIVSEFRGNTVHFTPLICYQIHKENAPECLKIKHYTEFKSSKGLVLMRGEFDKNVINVIEAQCLANQFQLYYGQRYPEKTNLLEQFTKKPDEFKHSDLIKQIESLTL